MHPLTKIFVTFAVTLFTSFLRARLLDWLGVRG